MNGSAEKERLTALMQHAAEMMLPIAGDGWFVDVPTGQLGPISSAALERLVSTGEVRLTTLIWHETLEDWAPLQSVLSNEAPGGLEVALPTKPDPLGGQSEAIRGPTRQPTTYGPAATLFSSGRVKIMNTLHLLCAFVAAVVALLASVALINAREPVVIVALLILAFTYLVFWTGIEMLGVTIEDRVLRCPVRLSYWPHILPIGRQAIPVETIQSLSVSSLGSHIHFLQLTTNTGDRKILFEDVFMREVLLLAIRTTTPIGQPFSNGKPSAL
jgi:hypothetical protein